MFSGKRILILDMNGTFMFGEDRFGEAEDFSLYYFQIGGKLPKDEINRIVRTTYEYLAARYTDESFRHNFPSVEYAVREVAGGGIERDEMEKIVDTFAFHELGYIPSEYVTALHKLRKRFLLAAVIDIWAPKTAWLNTFVRTGIANLFSVTSFSSDHGVVKPSPKPFEMVLSQLGMARSEAIVIGDSPRRDLGGAKRAGIDCILIGGSEHPDAIKKFTNLLALGDAM